MGDCLIQKKSFEFAIGIVRLYRKLQARQEFVLSPHLLRSGTRIGIQVEQAFHKRDQQYQLFLEKILAAIDDARETQYWLRLLQESRLADIDVSLELHQIEEVIQLLEDTVRTEGELVN